ncbi:MAG TPA: hypothetical protein VN794_21910 [Methylomirabilota bacterium]|nr:hypothetical protein [Methylomirabilota bacterium]
MKIPGRHPIRSKRRTRTALGCAAALITLLLLIRFNQPPDPLYQGRAITDWVKHGELTDDQLADAAQKLGDALFPPIEGILRSGTKTERAIFNRSPSRFWVRWPLKVTFLRSLWKDRAMSYLEKLGPRAVCTTPALLEIVQDGTEGGEQRSKALQTLVAVHADPSLVLPILKKLAEDPAMVLTARSYTEKLGEMSYSEINHLGLGPMMRYHGSVPADPRASYSKIIPKGPSQVTRPPSRFQAPPSEPAPFRPDEPLLASGFGPKMDLEDLEHAAQSGDLNAQTRLAAALYSGQSRTTNFISAYQWASVAAARGSTEARHLIREMELFLSPTNLAEGRAAATALLERQAEGK